jgi:H/ACA ribonucleoprotein complex subunit 3
VQVNKTKPTTVTEIFRTQGIILTACCSQDKLYWLYWENGEFKREDNVSIFTGDLDPYMRFWLQGKSTLIGKFGQVITVNQEQSLTRLATDNYQNLPMLNCNQFARYWLYQGQLLRDGKLGQEYIGDVLQGQTQFWVGEQFGFGFYCAGNLKVAFVFDAQRRGIKDQVKLPQWGGKILDSDCYFGSDICWFFLTIQEQNITVNHVYLIQSDGTTVASTKAQGGITNYLDSIHGHCAVNNFLLVATDEGIVRLEAHNGQIIKTRDFPDTEPFVDHSCYLYPCAQGLYVVTQQKITLLEIR